jgi:hypothetical protein
VSKLTLDVLRSIHGEPESVTYVPPRKHGAKMSIGSPPPGPRIVDQAWWSCGQRVRVSFGGHNQTLALCTDQRTLSSNRKAMPKEHFDRTDQENGETNAAGI